jgi:hypothetical protein
VPKTRQFQYRRFNASRPNVIRRCRDCCIRATLLGHSTRLLARHACRSTGELVGIEDDGVLELLVEVVAFDAEAVVVLAKVVQLLAVIGAINGLHDARRVAVERLTGRAGECGLSGDGTVGTIENSGGVGDTKRRR